MKRWTAVTIGFILALGLGGCKLEKSTGEAPLRLPKLHRSGEPGPAEPTPSAEQPAPEGTAMETGTETAPEQEPAPAEQAATAMPGREEEAAAGTPPPETATPAAAAKGTASSEEEETAESPQEEAAEKAGQEAGSEVQPATTGKPAPPKQAPPAPPAPARPESQPTPGVKQLALGENARLLEAHLARAEDALQAMNLLSAKQALAGAVRAFSYLDAQRPAAVLAQALDQVSLHLDEKDFVAARVTLQRAEDWIEGTPLDKTMAESLLELDHRLKAKKLSSAVGAAQVIRNKLAERSEREDRILTALRTALVQAQLALERHTAGVALAEVQEARTQAEKLRTPAAKVEE